MADQLPLFGPPRPPRAFHLVSAHVRVQADGTEVFVHEHLRWNRGRSGRPTPLRAGPPSPEAPEQLPLFAGPPAHGRAP